MRIVLFSGSHARHTYVHKKLIENFNVCGIVSMQREAQIPLAPPGITKHDHELFDHHFRVRAEIESQAFGTEGPHDAYRGQNVHYVDSRELNSPATANFVTACRPDIAVIFGVDLIKEPVMSRLPKDRVNLHLGLSPWYRGSATLFWPFYFLEPHYAGATIHQIVAEADAGEIIHQVVPKFCRGDGIHDVGSRTVIDATRDLVKLLSVFETKGRFEQLVQRHTGRLFLSADFHPSHLRLIYDEFDDRIVDHHLDGGLHVRQPKIYRSPML